MRKTTLLERIARFLTGKTPGLAKEAEASCKKSSDRITEQDRQRVSASVNFRQAQGTLKETIKENVELNATAFSTPLKEA